LTKIFALHFDGAGTLLDFEVRAIFEAHGGRLVLCTSSPRNNESAFQYDVPRKHLGAVRAALAAAGFELRDQNQWWRARMGGFPRLH
jgi:hypothetical protein